LYIQDTMRFLEQFCWCCEPSCRNHRCSFRYTKTIFITTTFVVVFINFYVSVCLKEAVRNRSNDGVARDEKVNKKIGNPVSLLTGSPELIAGRGLIVRDSEGDSGLKALLGMVSHHENRSPSDLLTITVKTHFILELLHRCSAVR
jgi:hypothetical protein